MVSVAGGACGVGGSNGVHCCVDCTTIGSSSCSTVALVVLLIVVIVAAKKISTRLSFHPKINQVLFFLHNFINSLSYNFLQVTQS